MNDSEKINLLIVDDVPENIIVLEKILIRPDLNILKASSGNEALELVLEYDFALVLLDVQMPVMDGFETARLIRENESTKHIPIIFVTAISKESKHMFKGYEAGAVDYLFKPVDTYILRSKVNVFLDMYRQKESLKKANEELEKANRKIMEQQKAVIEEERLKVLLQMAGATAHELNQPLMTLLGSIELMQLDDSDPEKTDRYLSQIKESGQRISETVRKIQIIRHDEIKAHDSQSNIINFDQKVDILSVEDTDSDFEAIQKILENQDWLTLSRAVSVEEALMLFEKNKYDITFLDYFLEDGTGMDLLQNMYEKGIDVPVVVITGQGDEMLASRMIQSGAYEYLPKSRLNEKSLLRIINNTIEKSRLKNELQKAQEKLAEMSVKDELTSLYNSRYFKDALKKEFERSKRYNENMALAITDLDHFKNINDTYGHPAGDMVLERTGLIFRESTRLNDIVCRYGGEEFAIILPNMNSGSAFSICEKIRKKVENNIYEHDFNKIRVTISIGYALCCDTESVDELMMHADKALYHAKETGRNMVVEYTHDLDMNRNSEKLK